MKRIILMAIAIILLFVSTACAVEDEKQDDIVTDSIQNNENPVEDPDESESSIIQDEPVVPDDPQQGTTDNSVIKEVYTSAELFDGAGNKLADITFEYDSNGLLLSHRTSWLEGGGGGYQQSDFKYDSNGNVIEEIISSPYGINFEKKFEINDKGLPSKEIFAPDYYNNYTYEYDSKGNVKKQSVSDSYGWNYSYTYTYNADGTVETKNYYASSGTLLDTYEYTYDSNGRITKQEVPIESWETTGYVLFYYD